jgi:hypothetical protein
MTALGRSLVLLCVSAVRLPLRRLCEYTLPNTTVVD